MGTYDADVQKLYVAYFNRPADPLGLLYWNTQIANNGGSVVAVANAFSASAEYKAIYAGQTTAQIINTIYTNLFGRVAEPDGITYWGTRLDNGTFNIGTIAYSVYVGAQNADKTAIDSKATAAASFTTALDTNAEIVGYAGASANALAKTWLTGVTSAATLTTALASRDATITSAVAAGSSTTGTTYTLTTSIDALTGTSGNDTFVGDAAAISAADSISGGSGTDTLRLMGLGNATYALTTDSVEVLQLNSIHDSAVFNAATASTGLTSLVDHLSSNSLTVNNLKANATVTLNQVAAGKTTLLNYAAGVIGTAGAVAVVADTAGTAATAHVLDLDTAGTATDIVKTLTITGQNAKSNLTIASSTNAGEVALTTVNFAGNQSIKLADGANNPLATVTKVDGSTMTTGGSFNLNLTNNTANVTITGSLGNDKVTFGANQLNTNDSIGLGDGTLDTIVATLTNFTAASNDVKAINAATGVERVGTASTADIIADMTVFTSIKNFETTAAITGGTAGTTGAVGAGGAGATSAAGTAGLAGINMTTTAANTLYIDANIAGAVAGVGGTGQAAATGGIGGAGGAAGAGIALAASVNTGTDSVTLVFQKGGATTIEGGIGGNGGVGGAGPGSGTSGAGGVGGAGGYAVNASTVETLTIQTASSSDAVTFNAGAAGVSAGAAGGAGGGGTPGAGGAAGAAGSAAVLVGSNGTINITGAGAVTLGTVASSAGAGYKNLTIDGSQMSGALSVTTAGENDVIKAGTGGSSITLGEAAQAIVTITLGSGADNVTVGNATGTAAAATTITNFTSGVDKILWNGPGTPAFNSTKVDVSGAANLAGAIDLASAGAGNGTGIVRYFNYGSDTYVVLDAGAGATFATTDSVIKLVGITAVAAGDFTLS